jgi:8-oxo-dGTP pyrophosphatase MutT (NUDIX family)
MRFDAVARRLDAFPTALPAPLEALMPVVVGDGPERRTRRVVPPGAAARPAAVLALLYPDRIGDTRIVLIERPAYDGHHSGEVSLPGGKAEHEDDGPAATALREAAEEVGLDPVRADVRVVGQLDAVWIPVSDFHVTPVVAVAGRRPRLVPHPGEVARILEPPVDLFLPDARMDMVERTVGSWPLRYGHFEVDGLSVWGMTARVLSQLGAVLTLVDDGSAEAPRR